MEELGICIVVQVLTITWNFNVLLKVLKKLHLYIGTFYKNESIQMYELINKCHLNICK